LDKLSQGNVQGFGGSLSLFNRQGLPPGLLYGVTLDPSKSIKGFKVNSVRRISCHKGVEGMGKKFGGRSRFGEVSAVSLIKQRQGGSRLETKLTAG
jgi:hypothetical protein